MCTRESGAVYEAGGLNCVLTFIKEHGSVTQSAGSMQGLKVFTDTLHSAMTVVSRLCGKMEPQDSSLPSCIESLSSLLKHDDPFVSDSLVWMLIFAFLRNGLDVSYLNLIRVPLLHPGAVIFCHLTFFSLHFCKAYTASFTVICLHGTLPLYLTDEFL